MNRNFKQQAMTYMAGNLTCQNVASIITDYLEDAMPFSTRLRFHLHLGLCFSCRNYLKQMKYTIQTLGKLPTEPIAPEIREELLHRFRHWKKENP
ncbi:zf-HC2 domain-containing protein [Nitrospira sp. M1]